MLSIIGKNDKVLYALQWSKDTNLQQHFLLQSSLDKFDLNLWKTSSYFMNRLEEDNQQGKWAIYGYATSKNTKFLMYLDKKDEFKKDDKIKNFLIEIHRLYAQVMLNPLYTINDQIKSESFDNKVKSLLRDNFNI